MPDNWILLIDPCRSLHLVYRFFFEREGYHVETALNLKEASCRVSLRTYLSIVTEFLRPLEAISPLFQRIKEQTPETYILMVTDAIIDDATYDQLFAAGVDDFISKPCSPQRILTHIKKGRRQRELLLRKRDLETQSILDPLSEHSKQYIFSPTYLKKCVREELKKARRHGSSFSFILAEIPPREKMGGQFETFCIELSGILRRSTREEDLVGRENGNFGILLPETNGAGSHAVMSRLSILVRMHSLFKADEVLSSVAREVFFRSFTYPADVSIPESFKKVFEEVNREYPYQ